jgi:hypothetical protein
MALLLDGTDTKVSFQAVYRGLKDPTVGAPILDRAAQRRFAVLVTLRQWRVCGADERGRLLGPPSSLISTPFGDYRTYPECPSQNTRASADTSGHCSRPWRVGI